MTAVAQRQFLHWAEDDIYSWLVALDYDRLLYAPQYSKGLPVIERFDWQGQPVDPGFRRLRVMGRQAYVLCHAAIGGCEGVRALASRAISAMIDHGIGRDGQFYCQLLPDGCALRKAPDLYDIAFGLFAMAWWYRLSGDERAIVIAENSLDHLRTQMRSPTGLGFRAGADEMSEQRHEQNPHMHLFESAIFLAAFTGRPIFRALADELFDLVETALFDRTTGILPEFFDSEWRPAGKGGVLRIEAGHHYEWVWLLHRYAALSGQSRAFTIAKQLFAFAYEHGHDKVTGLVFDAVNQDGRPLEKDFRIWPNTEMLKAQVAMQEHHGSGLGFDDSAILANVQRIRSYFLTRQPHGPAAVLREGWWIDHLDGSLLLPKSDHVPASSLYHIFFAFAELLRHRAGHDPFSGLPW